MEEDRQEPGLKGDRAVLSMSQGFPLDRKRSTQVRAARDPHRCD